MSSVESCVLFSFSATATTAAAVVTPKIRRLTNYWLLYAFENCYYTRFNLASVFVLICFSVSLKSLVIEWIAKLTEDVCVCNLVCCLKLEMIRLRLQNNWTTTAVAVAARTARKISVESVKSKGKHVGIVIHGKCHHRFVSYTLCIRISATTFHYTHLHKHYMCCTECITMRCTRNRWAFFMTARNVLCVCANIQFDYNFGWDYKSPTTKHTLFTNKRIMIISPDFCLIQHGLVWFARLFGGGEAGAGEFNINAKCSCANYVMYNNFSSVCSHKNWTGCE